MCVDIMLKDKNPYESLNDYKKNLPYSEKVFITKVICTLKQMA